MQNISARDSNGVLNISAIKLNEILVLLEYLIVLFVIITNKNKTANSRQHVLEYVI